MIKEIIIFCVLVFVHMCVRVCVCVCVRTWTEIYYIIAGWCGCWRGREVKLQGFKSQLAREDVETVRGREDQCCTCQDPIKGIETHGRTDGRAGGRAGGVS